MKLVCYNPDSIKKSDIEHVIKRAKLLIENENEEFLLAYSYNNYHIIGGHVNNGESDEDCILREVKEEAGIVLENTDFNPIVEIQYIMRVDNKNTLYSCKYYYSKINQKPNGRSKELTYQEKQGDLKIKRIKKQDVLDVLEKSYETCTKKIVLDDTILVVKEYLKNQL